MIQLTDELIRDAFLKTGFDEKYFPVYEEKVKQAYDERQEDEPDDDETTEQESNVFRSIRRANDYIAYYIEEIEKGHGDTWAASIAENRGIEDETDVVKDAYDSIEDKKQREKDLDIYVNSLSDDIIFRERYKYLFQDFDLHPREKAAEYCEIYHRCIKAGKSAIYAHAFETFICDVANLHENNFKLDMNCNDRVVLMGNSTSKNSRGRKLGAVMMGIWKRKGGVVREERRFILGWRLWFDYWA